MNTTEIEQINMITRKAYRHVGTVATATDECTV